MKVVIPAVERGSVAEQALICERVPHEVHLMTDDFAYGRMFAQLWAEGEDFAIVEHDIVPWPGALQGLCDCPRDYCGHYYQISGKLGGTLGCVKFGADLIESVGPLDTSSVHWNRLDGVVAAAIEAATGADDFHIHTPPVAHLHRYR